MNSPDAVDRLIEAAANSGMNYSQSIGLMLHAIARLTAMSVFQSGNRNDEPAEIIRHEFDILYTGYLNELNSRR